ncbi:MAG: CCC motif membrane protein [Flavobacterium sp.]|uniref:CCC motif membrane protein n=1 Tax=Flavobacterium sp. TaxID=239 RepID=UPI0022CC5057|nr:CCC motif membrane protein [Flavobacterium sp.]MCZ8198457.1 CCC motif membrane protein [Flavobacterium sp.]
MENQKLPNATTVLILALLSIMTCWLLVGLIFAVAAIYISKGDLKLYHENPKRYDNYQTLLIGRVLTGIGIFINIFYLVFVIYVYTVIGFENLDSFNKNIEAKKEYIEEHR